MKRMFFAISILAISGAATCARQETSVPVHYNQESEAQLKKITVDRMQVLAGMNQDMEGVLLSANPVKGAPFTATLVTENTGTLRDGTHINRTNSVQVARDSEGRTRREAENMIMIVDPVAQVSYSLNKRNHTAVKLDMLYNMTVNGETMTVRALPDQVRDDVKMKAEAELKAAEAANAEGGGRGGKGGKLELDKMSEPVEEDLGTQMMEGVAVSGKRITRTFPTNSPVGNDQPIKIVSEQWYSPDLQMNIMTHNDDPRQITTTTVHYTNLKRGEPDAALFQVPADYTITARR
jgi:hypothetical protein